MYADHLSAGRKRSIQDRLYAGIDPRGPSSSADTSGKRQRNTEENWRYGGFQDDKVLPLSRNQIYTRDARLSNLATGLHQFHQDQKKPRSGDLREKLSGSLPTQLTTIGLAKTKTVSVKAGLVKNKEHSEKPAVLHAPRQFHQDQKKPISGDLREKLSGPLPTHSNNIDLAKSKPVPLKAGLVLNKEPSEPSEKPAVLDLQKVTISKLPRQKSELSVDGLLQSLGLEKYSITFRKEEVDMTVLLHMTDTDLKALGIPMGPRKKIMWALNSRKQQQ